MWGALCRVLGRPDLTEDSRFLSAHQRSVNRNLLWPILESLFLARDAVQWRQALDGEGVPVAIVNTIDRVTVDPQIKHRGMVIELVSGDGRRAEVMGDPIFMQESRRTSHTFPPASGEHTELVLKELLGLSADEVNALIASGSAFVREGIASGNLAAQGIGRGGNPPVQ